ncbi:DUF7263 family protein [Halobaculum sp. D14]|uniref:DUF7263 family protein n=1 Tax=unclassified Halobaculum TaxID=2640896 RepID=UPI003EBFB12A
MSRQRSAVGFPAGGRGQASLLALAAALVALTAAIGLSVAFADAALASADRSPVERRAAVTATDRVVAPDSPLTRRANVLDRGAVDALTADALVDLVPPLADAAFRVRLGGRTVVERGDPVGGTAFRRIVLVAADAERTRSIDAAAGAVTLPRRTGTLRFDFTDSDVETVRVNGRVVLHRDGGLAGTESVAVSRFETARITVDGNATGTIRVSSYPERTVKATLEVTVDA